MNNNQQVILRGSHKQAPVASCTHSIDGSRVAEITVRLRRKNSVDDLIATGKQITYQEYAQQYGASQQDVDAVVAFAKQYTLVAKPAPLAQRTVMLSGTLNNLQKAFGVKLDGYTDNNGNHYRGRSGAIHIPANLEGIIEGVFGLDDRPAAKPKFKLAQRDGEPVSHDDSPCSFSPGQLADTYGFPSEMDGSGQCIAIIELSGGYVAADMDNYFSSLGMHTPAIYPISVDGGSNVPGADNTEVILDIQVAGAVAPGAKLVVYFASNSAKGFIDAITQAINDTTYQPSAIAISWGAAEMRWTQRAFDNFNEAFKSAAALGITVCVASGDAGSADGVDDGKAHVDFPASSPYVLACGGTKLTIAADGTLNEVVWHENDTAATGGGISEYFELPAYQTNANIPASVNTGFKGRGVPDVAANADSVTGYRVFAGGKPLVIGGTSAVAPLMAALIVRLNQKNGTRAGFINPKLYADPSVCRSITDGNNITTSTGKGYTAGPGWDACTGWGVLSKL